MVYFPELPVEKLTVPQAEWQHCYVHAARKSPLCHLCSALQSTVWLALGSGVLSATFDHMCLQEINT